MTVWCDGRYTCHTEHTLRISSTHTNLEGTSRSLGHTSCTAGPHTECTARAYECTAMAWQTGEAMSWPSRESPRPNLPVWPLGQQSFIATDRTYWCSCVTEKPRPSPSQGPRVTPRKVVERESWEA